MKEKLWKHSSKQHSEHTCCAAPKQVPAAEHLVCWHCRVRGHYIHQYREPWLAGKWKLVAVGKPKQRVEDLAHMSNTLIAVLLSPPVGHSAKSLCSGIDGEEWRHPLLRSRHSGSTYAGWDPGLGTLSRHCECPSALLLLV